MTPAATASSLPASLKEKLSIACEHCGVGLVCVAGHSCICVFTWAALSAEYSLPTPWGSRLALCSCPACVLLRVWGPSAWLACGRRRLWDRRRWILLPRPCRVAEAVSSPTALGRPGATRERCRCPQPRAVHTLHSHFQGQRWVSRVSTTSTSAGCCGHVGWHCGMTVPVSGHLSTAGSSRTPSYGTLSQLTLDTWSCAACPTSSSAW